MILRLQLQKIGHKTIYKGYMMNNILCRLQYSITNSLDKLFLYCVFIEELIRQIKVTNTKILIDNVTLKNMSLYDKQDASFYFILRLEIQLFIYLHR